METATIIQIKNQKDLIIQSLESYRHALKNVDKTIAEYGSENEYSINGLIDGIKSILADVSYLIKSHNIFIKVSTYDDRVNLRSHLSALNTHIQGSNHQNIAVTIERLKPIIRSFNLQLDKERFIDFKSAIDDLQKNTILLDEEIENTKRKLTESENLHNGMLKTKVIFDEQLKEIETNKEELETKVNEFVSEFGSFQNLVEKATENEANISTKLEEVKASQVVFDSFVSKIGEREKQLELQKTATEDYEESLKSYTAKQKEIEIEAESLIQKAIQSLHYSNATGLSEAFSKQHQAANNKLVKAGWLFSAGLFISTTIALGVWVVTGWGIDPNIENQVVNIVGRVSMIPVALLGALFCAKQYINQKNLIEDYAYKTVLAKSIVAFSEQLRDQDKDKYSEYLSIMLKEIHQDPLRKRGKEKDEASIKDTAGLVEKIFAGIKSLRE